MPKESSVERITRAALAEGIRSEYLNRLKRRVDVEQAHDDLKTEIAGEMANALGNAEAKVNAALLECELCEAALDQAHGAERKPALARYEAAREQAIRKRRDFEIHREAVGLRKPRGFDAMYPIPKRRE